MIDFTTPLKNPMGAKMAPQILLFQHISKFAWPSAIGVADNVPFYTARCFIV